MPKGTMVSEKKLTPIKAIRKHCLDCCCYQKAVVKNCSFYDCPLYPYRMGHNPNRKGIKGKDMSKLLEAKKSRVGV
jgi:hypothetical protein